MNALTREIVEKVARKHWALAKENGDSFFSKVENEYWFEMMERFGFDLQVRSLELAKVFFPEMFDEDGEFMNYEMRFAHCEIQLAQKVKRVMSRKIKAHPEAWMLYNWGAILPEILMTIEIERTPQMRLF